MREPRPGFPTDAGAALAAGASAALLIAGVADGGAAMIYGEAGAAVLTLVKDTREREASLQWPGWTVAGALE